MSVHFLDQTPFAENLAKRIARTLEEIAEAEGFSMENPEVREVLLWQVFKMLNERETHSP